MSILEQCSIGWRAIWRGFHFLGRHRCLWPWAAIPWFIQLLVLGILIALFISHADTLFTLATPFLPRAEATVPDAWLAKIVWGLYWFLAAILRLIFYILIPLILLLVTFVFGLIVAGPFNDLLSEQVEHLATGREEPAFSWRLLCKSITRSLVVECQKAVIFLGAPVAFLVLHLIPLAGSLLYVILTGVFEMWAAGFAFVDFPMGRRCTPLRERMAFARRHKVALLSFGTIFWIPGLMILCAPPLVVGGTLMYVELTDEAIPEK